MAVPLDFIDREPEQKALGELFDPENPTRVYAYIISKNIGKTYLTWWFHDYCAQRNFKVVRIDFDQRNRDVMAYWKFVRTIREELGPELFAEAGTLEARGRPGMAPIIINTGAGNRGVSLGEGGQYQNAQFQQITGGDNINISQNYVAGNDAHAEQRKREMDEMGRAFRADLEKLSSREPVIFIFDAFEQVTQETSRWLGEWLFDLMDQHYPQLYIMIAGKEEKTLPESPGFKSILQRFDSFGAPSMEHIRQYVVKNRLNVPEDGLNILLSAASVNMGLLGQLRDALRSQRGSNA